MKLKWILIAVLFFIIASRAFGAGGSPVTLQNPLGCNDFGVCVCKLAGALFWLSVPVVVVMVLVGGIQMLFAGGDPEKFRSGRSTIVYAVIGFVVILLARGAVIAIYQVLGGTGSIGC